MNLRVHTLSCPEQFAEIAREWGELDAQIAPRTPFTSAPWIQLWWDHYERRRLLVADRFFAHVVRSGTGELIAVAPMMLSRRPGFGPLSLRVLSFFGADTSITELRGIICRAEHQADVVRVLADFLQDKRGDWDLIMWSGLRADSATLEILKAKGPLIAASELPDYVIPLPQTWKDLTNKVSSNMRKNLRKSYESLEQAGHEFAFRIVDDPPAVREALDRFFLLHSKRAQTPDMIKHPDKFAAPRNRRFLIDYVGQMAALGRMRIFELHVNGAIVASRLAFLLDRDLYFYYAGYDPAWRDFSVMTVLMAEALKWAIEHAVDIVNLSTGKDQSKLRWKPDEIVFQTFVQASQTLRGRLSGRAYQTLARMGREVPRDSENSKTA
jgi:CelD/BcsL family acetyltransferase involved in cellulose biosynthesis